MLCQPFSAQSTSQDRIIIEAGTRPVLYPVHDYSNCCPEAEQRVYNVRIDNITDLMASSGSAEVSWLGLSERVAMVEDNQIELNVRSTVLSISIIIPWIHTATACDITAILGTSLSIPL